MKDLIDELEATTRLVGADTLPAGEAKVVMLSRRYPADAEDVWDAITTPERLAGWSLPVSGDLRLGGTYQLEGNAGGEIRACEPPRRLQLTWIMGEPPGPEDSSIVDVVLEPDPDGGGTTLTLTHTAVVPPEMWDTFGPGAVGVGWELGCSASPPTSTAASSARPPSWRPTRRCGRPWSPAARRGAPRSARPAPTTRRWPGPPPPPPSSMCRPPRDRRRVAACEGAAARAGPGRPPAPGSAVRARG